MTSEPKAGALDADSVRPCGCYRCLTESGETVNMGGWSAPVTATMMVVCGTCGNKRCPHATDHRLMCTGSNEPGQEGSNYGPPLSRPAHSADAGDVVSGGETKEQLAKRLIGEVVAEEEARKRLIGLIEQWDGETEYEAEDIAALADDILHEFNGPPVAALRPSAGAGGEPWPEICDGKEQLAFEEWATKQRFEMNEHPLHYLFLDPRTDAARQGWKAGLEYAAERVKQAARPDPETEGLRERVRVLEEAALAYEDMLRSAFSAAQRDATHDVRGTTNFRLLADRISAVLTEHRAVVRPARLKTTDGE